MHCRRSDFPRCHVPRRERGAALIVAMLIFALAAALIVAMRSEFDRYYQRSANLLADEQIQAYLRGGEELAAMVLIRDYDQDKTENQAQDDLEEIWNSAEVRKPFPLDGIGWFQGELEDLQGRFNLNRLADRVPAGQDPAKRFTPAQKQFIRLLQALGEPAVSEPEAIAITESVSDWLDADEETSPDGAEDTVYSGRTPAYRAANREFASVSELRAVANMTPEIFLALTPWVTVLPETTTTLNILTAPPMLLRTINADDDLSPLSEAEGEALVGAGFTDVTTLFATPVFANRSAKLEEIRPLLDKRSSYFLLTATAEVAGREMHLYSVLKRHNRAVGAIARANGSLYRRCVDVAPAPQQQTLGMRRFCEIPL